MRDSELLRGRADLRHWGTLRAPYADLRREGRCPAHGSKEVVLVRNMLHSGKESIMSPHEQGWVLRMSVE